MESGTIRNEIYSREVNMWEAAKNGDKRAFCGLVAEDAVMVCGGYRCTGAEYSAFTENFGISAYEISNFEIVLEADNVCQSHYIVKTAADCPENSDMAGTFHVTSTWIRRGGDWALIFNMDSRITE